MSLDRKEENKINKKTRKEFEKVILENGYGENIKVPFWKKTFRSLYSLIMTILAIITLALSPYIYNFYQDYEASKEIQSLAIENDTSPIIEIPDRIFRNSLNGRGFDLNKDGQFSEYEVEALLTKSTKESVNLNGKNILSSIEGIQYFKSLRQFKIIESQLEDISPLVSLENLSYVYISDSYINDISPLLNSKEKLKKVLITDSKIEDLTPLLELTQRFDTLNFVGNPLRRESEEFVFMGYIGANFYGNYEDPDTGLSQPYEVWGGKELVDWDELSVSAPIQFKDLKLKEALVDKKIDINKDGEISIYEAERLKGYLELINYDIDDISGMKNFTNLISLDVSENNIKSIDELFELKNLRYLKADKNEISKVESNETHINLLELNLMKNQIETIEDIKIQLPIESLYISKNPLESLKGLDQFPKLRMIFAKNCKLTTLHGIGDNLDLERIYFHHNPFNMENLNEIGKLKKLKQLKMSGSESRVKDISMILELENITSLGVNSKYINSSGDGNTVLIGEKCGYEIWTIDN